jgi:hypothetical protein
MTLSAALLQAGHVSTAVPQILAAAPTARFFLGLPVLTAKGTLTTSAATVTDLAAVPATASALLGRANHPVVVHDTFRVAPAGTASDIYAALGRVAQARSQLGGRTVQLTQTKTQKGAAEAALRAELKALDKKLKARRRSHRDPDDEEAASLEAQIAEQAQAADLLAEEISRPHPEPVPLAAVARAQRPSPTAQWAIPAGQPASAPMGPGQLSVLPRPQQRHGSSPIAAEESTIATPWPPGPPDQSRS